MAMIAYKNTYNDLRHKKIGDLLKYMKRAKASVKKMLGKLSRGLTGFDALARAGRGSAARRECRPQGRGSTYVRAGLEPPLLEQL